MTETATVAELFQLAIAAERAAEALYYGMADQFATLPEVAAFWQRYAREESNHAAWLIRFREELPKPTLEEPADPEALKQAHQALKHSLDAPLANVTNLDEAYQLASDLENGETNAVFEFIITHFAQDREAQAFLRAQLRDHIARLMHGFPRPYDTPDLRRSVRAAATPTS